MHALRSLPRSALPARQFSATVCRSAQNVRFYSSSADDNSGAGTAREKAQDTSSDASNQSKKKADSTAFLSETLKEMSESETSAEIPTKPRSPHYASFFQLPKSPPPGQSGSGAPPARSPKPVERWKLKVAKKRAKQAAKKVTEKMQETKQSEGVPPSHDEQNQPPPEGATSRQPKRKVKETLEPQLFSQNSDFAPEEWAGEPWKDGASDDYITTSMEPRSPPPHIVKQEVARSAVLQTVDQVLDDVAPIAEMQPVDTLSHDLGRVLFNPGVHWLQDPRSRVYNFTPWLQRIPKVNDFAFERLTGFVKSSRDEELRALANREGRKFAGSTSSLSGMLCHIYFLLSEFKDVDYSVLSQHYKNQPSSFTSGQRMPASVLLNYKDGVYAIDSHSDDSDDPDKNVLTWLGTLLENFLTKDPETFKKFMRFESSPIQPEERDKPTKQAYRYAKSNKFVMRSQLDCQDKRLPGTGVFDIKTRACVTIRMDILNYEENAGYLIKNQTGEFESFEREYYDLIRSGFLKYSFQARIGNMDGVMVTYHNTERIFGFQYISVDEMDERLFGPVPGIGNKVFSHCVSLLEEIMEEVASCFPKTSVLCFFETRLPGRVLEVYVHPAEWDEEKDGPKPIKKLVITLDHQSGGMPVRPVTAMRQPDHWTVSYQIGRPALSDTEVGRDFVGMQFRKKRLLTLPSSVSNLEEGEVFWGGLRFSKTADTTSRPFTPESFTLATAAVEKYREMARQGRRLAREMEQLELGKPKVVVGEGLYEEDEDWTKLLDEGRVVDVNRSRDLTPQEMEALEVLNGVEVPEREPVMVDVPPLVDPKNTSMDSGKLVPGEEVSREGEATLESDVQAEVDPEKVDSDTSSDISPRPS